MMINDVGKQPAKAAFEVGKSVREVMTLSETDVEKYLDPEELLGALEEGFRALELGKVQTPARARLTVPGKGFSLSMPAWQPGLQLTVKVVNVFEGNLESNLPNHLAIINLFDPDTGAVSCVMDGTYITAIRTAATALLSIRMLSRSESRIVTVIGAGVQAREHVRLLPLIRDFKRINVCSLRFDDAQKLAAQSEIGRATADVEAAVRESDVVCLATHSAEAVIRSEWLRPGTHVTSVGYHPPNGELPKDLARTRRLFVETLDSFQAPPVGCAELAGMEISRGTTLGVVALGKKPARISDGEITVYKGVGIAMEDMIAANLVYQKARRKGGGGIMIW